MQHLCNKDVSVLMFFPECNVFSVLSGVELGLVNGYWFLLKPHIFASGQIGTLTLPVYVAVHFHDQYIVMLWFCSVVRVVQMMK